MACFERSRDLFSGDVIFHQSGIVIAVVEYGTVFINQRNTNSIRVDTFEEIGISIINSGLQDQTKGREVMDLVLCFEHLMDHDSCHGDNEKDEKG